MNVIEPRCGVAFELNKGQRLKVTDIKGEQVSDFFCFLKDDKEDYLSSGRTLDYMSKLYLSEGDLLYSSKSRVMAKIVEDRVGRHDFTLTPCSKDTFQIIYDDQDPHRGCEGNLIEAFERHGLALSSVPTTFNIFMNVALNNEGMFEVLAPRSKAGDYLILEATEDLLVGLTACSALQSNNGSFKPIGFEIYKEVCDGSGI